MSNNRCPKNKIFLFSFLNKYRCVSPDAFHSLISNEIFILVMTLLYQNTDTQMPYFLQTVEGGLLHPQYICSVKEGCQILPTVTCPVKEWQPLLVYVIPDSFLTVW